MYAPVCDAIHGGKKILGQRDGEGDGGQEERDRMGKYHAPQSEGERVPQCHKRREVRPVAQRMNLPCEQGFFAVFDYGHVGKGVGGSGGHEFAGFSIRSDGAKTPRLENAAL